MSEARDSLWAGVRFGWVAEIVGAVIILLVGVVSENLVMLLAPWYLFGLVQLVWMLPLYVLSRRRGWPEHAKGLLVVTGIMFLLWSVCFAMMPGTRRLFQ